MSRRMIPILLILVVGGCSMVRSGLSGPAYQPVSASTTWPSPVADPTTCAQSGPTGDKPTDKTPGDTLRIKSKMVRQTLATVCSFAPIIVKGDPDSPVKNQ